MKKAVVLVAAFVCTVLFASSSFAALTTITKTAEVTFSGGAVEFSATLLTLASSTATAKISWDTASIPLDSSTTTWKVANAYALLSSTITSASGKVYMYQDNKSATGNYVAVSSRTEQESGINYAKYNGLVKSGSGGGEKGYLSMSFITVPSTVTLTTAYDIEPKETGDNAYKNRYITDKSDENYSSGSAYTLIVDGNGYVINTNESNEPNYYPVKTTDGKMYFGAGFKEILGGTSYGTDKIIFQIVTE